ncbi:hypothetical protein HYPSUDRAFT_208125 [Hypholoma sublateritium FD-334 SS-4]|uniref:Uncharacterized protein n=1 Tax=Hypholoma sublateritium (strain FD-334 SS-4) TaxID=945553 RepID=A0A0D2P3N4_HYPSF|nr:hypothetical protein HYPSUDRAFT_208125 [Hypholoma sublateritium FD-334 SS-4]
MPHSAPHTNARRALARSRRAPPALRRLRGAAASPIPDPMPPGSGHPVDVRLSPAPPPNVLLLSHRVPWGRRAQRRGAMSNASNAMAAARRARGVGTLPPPLFLRQMYHAHARTHAARFVGMRCAFAPGLCCGTARDAALYFRDKSPGDAVCAVLGPSFPFVLGQIYHAHARTHAARFAGMRRAPDTGVRVFAGFYYHHTARAGAAAPGRRCDESDHEIVVRRHRAPAPPRLSPSFSIFLLLKTHRTHARTHAAAWLICAARRAQIHLRGAWRSYRGNIRSAPSLRLGVLVAPSTFVSVSQQNTAPRRTHAAAWLPCAARTVSVSGWDARAGCGAKTGQKRPGVRALLPAFRAIVRRAAAHWVIPSHLPSSSLSPPRRTRARRATWLECAAYPLTVSGWDTLTGCSAEYFFP